MSSFTQMRLSYERDNLTPEQIAEEQELDLVAVKSALMQCSSAYRKACGAEPPDEDTLNFSDDDLRVVNKKLMEIAVSAETSEGTPDYKLQAQVCQYIRDDKKGRKEIIRQVAGTTFNVLQFNEQLKSVRAMSEANRARLIEA